MVTKSALRQSSSVTKERVAAANSLHAMGGLMGARSPPLSCSVACTCLLYTSPSPRDRSLS
eukprot:45809-Pyramimonas_sp.AAC.1